jgi:hypothetical protein
MANASTLACNAFGANLILAQAAACAGVVSDIQQRADGAWTMWATYCASP